MFDRNVKKMINYFYIMLGYSGQNKIKYKKIYFTLNMYYC